MPLDSCRGRTPRQRLAARGLLARQADLKPQGTVLHDAIVAVLMPVFAKANRIHRIEHGNGRWQGGSLSLMACCSVLARR